jgi:ABC-2 type transport system permease protein
MSILQASFSHTSSSIMMGKMMNTIGDIISAPLTAAEVTFAIILAACTRSFLITLLSIVIFSFLIDVTIYSISLLFIFTFLGSFILGSIGFVAGLHANKFDEMSGIQNFIIVPCTMLSGVFYTIDKLPPFFQIISQFNPFWYIIDGMRFSFLGVADSSITKGLIYLSVLAVVTWLISFILYSKGYKIKA